MNLAGTAAVPTLGMGGLKLNFPRADMLSALFVCNVTILVIKLVGNLYYLLLAMRIKTKKQAVVTFPVTSLRPLYSSKRGKKRKLIFEADIDSLKKVNEPDTIDEMVAEARLEYASGKLKT